MDFDPTRAPTVPRDAATVILLRPRDGDGAAEVFLLRRHRGASFMAQAFVFPGGGRDGQEDLRETAARELREEANVRIEAAALVPFSHWITPSAEKKRFSARFFVAELPAGETPRYDGAETVEQLWITPADALARSAELYLPPPQLRTLLDIRDVAAKGPAAVLAFARARAAHVKPIVPRFAKVPAAPSGFALLLPWDPEYESLGQGDGERFPEGHPFAGGPTRFFMEGLVFRHVDPSGA
ncbi:MAG: NUDIX domain-containing protein [Planctomycetota bacterium]